MLIQNSFRHPEVAASAIPVLAPDVAALIGAARPCAVTFYRANEPVFAQGDAAGPLYLVEFGAVRICRLTADGRRQISGFCFAGDVFGFEAGAEHQCYAESIDGAGIRVLRPAANGGFGAGVLSLALRSLARAQDHLVLLGRMSATEKMAKFLLDLIERRASDRLIDLPMQRNDIADYLGLTFETVSRVLRVLKDGGLIRLPRIDQIEILDQAGLEALCE
jgi:CRP/FNR family nitrogen fixation transcriptional regulator